MDRIFDWAKAVERNRDILIRVVAQMFVMARIVPGELPASGLLMTTLPSAVYRAVLLILRPAEAALRRLIIMAAQDDGVGVGAVQPPQTDGPVRTGAGECLAIRRKRHRIDPSFLLTESSASASPQ